jgi:hypothetical protein
MFSVMAQERVALPFLKGVFSITKEQSFKGNMLRSMFDSYIQPVCRGATQTSELPLNLEIDISKDSNLLVTDYYAQQPSKLASNTAKMMTIFTHCQSLLAISDFMALVQSLFAIDPLKTMEIRVMVEEMFSGSNKFYEVQSSLALKNNLNNVIQNMRYMNNQLKNGSDQQDLEELETI